jgi:hypothetical protein
LEPPPFFGETVGAIWRLLYWIARVIVVIGCAYFVYHSAIRRKRPAMNIGPYWWTLFTVVGGIWTLLIYWLMEHSTLAARDDSNPS